MHVHNALTIEKTTGFTKETVSELSALKGEPDWLLEKRLMAWRIYDETPAPFWRRTDLSSLKLNDLIPYSASGMSGGPLAGLPAEMRLAEDERWSAGAVVQRDSTEVWRSLDKSLEAKGVIYTDMATAVRKHPEIVQQYMMTAGIAAGEDKFTALHGALWSGGTLLYVPKDVQIALPIVSLNWMDTAGLAFFSHTLIIAEAGSRLSFIEEFGSPSEEMRQSFHSGLVEIFVGERAEVTYAEVQNWGPGVISLTNKRAAVGRDAVMRWVGAHMGAKLSHGSMRTTLDQPGATMDMVGAYLATGRQHMDMDSLIDHVAPHTKGNVLYRGIIRDRAHTVFQGLIKVEKDAQQTDSYLANHNLLLSPKARADSLPTLEIEANDVRCTHGATVGQLDEEQLFYMRCRGLSRPEAERLIVAGFVQPVLDRIPEGGVRARVTAAVQAKLSV
jgi:Fe-S cluster assembly protein SufD